MNAGDVPANQSVGSDPTSIRDQLQWTRKEKRFTYSLT